MVEEHLIILKMLSLLCGILVFPAYLLYYKKGVFVTPWSLGHEEISMDKEPEKFRFFFYLYLTISIR